MTMFRSAEKPAPRRLVATALRRGDVVLTREPTATSWMIRAATGGEFSHALLCTDPPVLAEAVYKGAGAVALVDVRNYYVKDPSNIRVLRLKRKAASDDIIAAATLRASNLFGTPYALAGAVLSVTSASVPIDGVFCSMLIAMAFEKAGIRLANLPPEKITPAVLAASPLFDDVTHEILGEAPTEKERDRPALDEGRHFSKVRGGARSMAHLMIEIRPLLSELDPICQTCGLKAPLNLYECAGFFAYIHSWQAWLLSRGYGSKQVLDIVKAVDRQVASTIRRSGLADDFKAYKANDDVVIERMRDLAEGRLPGSALTDLYPLGWPEVEARYEHVSAKIRERREAVDSWAYMAAISPTAALLENFERTVIAELCKRRDALELLLHRQREEADRKA